MSTYETSVPGAGIYGQAQQAANQAYANAMTKIGKSRGALLGQYGYMKDAAGNLQVDPNNQFGQFQTMMQKEGQANTQARYAQHASGWGGSSGFLQNAMTQLRQANAAEHGQLGTGLQSGLDELTGQELDAKDTMNNTLWQAQLAQAQNAIANQQFNPGDMSNVDVPYPSGDAGAPAVQAKAIKGNTVLWGGSYKNKAQMASWLNSHGLNVKTWAKQHPTAAKAIGI